MMTESLIGEIRAHTRGRDGILLLSEVEGIIRRHEAAIAAMPHGAVARGMDKTQEAAKEERARVLSAPASNGTLIEEIKTVITVMMHEYFCQTPDLRDTSAWVDVFANKLAAIHNRGEMRLLNDVLPYSVKCQIADNISIESRSKSDVVQDVWDELVQRGLVCEPKRESVDEWKTFDSLKTSELPDEPFLVRCPDIGMKVVSYCEESDAFYEGEGYILLDRVSHWMPIPQEISLKRIKAGNADA